VLLQFSCIESVDCV